MNKLLFFLFLFSSSLYFAQQATVRGFVNDKSNGEVIPFQKVKLYSNTTLVAGALTDVNGFFSIPKLNTGTYLLKIENPQFSTKEETITITNASEIVQVKIQLEKNEVTKDLEEVKVSAASKQKTTDVAISQLKLDKKALERIPSMGAENDIVGAFSVTPGVITTGDQGGQMYVRGGTPIQNKILLDGMTIYSPFHSIGFFSIFETELVKNVDVYTGGFDAKFGGRISSIMDISYKDGNRKHLEGKLSLSPFMYKAVVEGPLGKKDANGLSGGSYLFSFKNSLLNLTSKKLYPTINNGDGLPYDFTDSYGKITLNAGGGSKFSFFGFHNNDAVNYSSIAQLNWKQQGGGMNILIVPGGSTALIKGHINGTNYAVDFKEQNAPIRSSSIGGVDLGFDFNFFQKNEGQLDAGINIQGFSTKYVTFNEAARQISDENFTFEIGSYLNQKFIFNRWVIQPGIRVQSYTSRDVTSFEPRLGIKYNATEYLRFKASGGRFSQNFTSASSDRDVVNLFNGLLSAPSSFQSKLTLDNGDVVDVTSAIQFSWHGVAGFELDLGKYWNLNIEGYYKYFPQLSNINQNKLYDDISENATVNDVYKKDFIIETGKSYGVDFLLKYSKDRLFLWGVYSLSTATRWDGFKTYFPVFDRRHNINLVGSYTMGKTRSFEINVRWNLGSGLPFTPTAGFIQQEKFENGITTDITKTNTDAIQLILGNFNSERLPYYHRLDITLKKTFKFSNRYSLETIGSVTNAYNRNNIFYVNRVSNDKIYQFPLMVSAGMNFKF